MVAMNLHNYFFLSIFTFAASQELLNTCQPNVFYTRSVPHPDDPKLYHFCTNGEFVGNAIPCSFPTDVYDIYLLVCVPNGLAFPGLTPSCATISGKEKVPSKDFCRQYYNCEIENEGTLETCPEETPFFDYKSMKCLADSRELFCYPASSKEDPNPPPPTTTTTEKPTTTEEVTTPELTTTEPPTTPTTTEEITTTPEPEPTTEEITTTTQSPINTCQPNTNYLDALPHPSDCQKRVFCGDGDVISESSCTNGWIFDYVYLSCIAVGDCYPGDKISCSNHGNTKRDYVPHPKYCRQYYDCTVSNSQELKAGRACQEPTPFFDYRLMKCGTEEDTLCYPGTSREIPPPPDKFPSFYYNN